MRMRFAGTLWLLAIGVGGGFVAGGDSCLPDAQRREIQAAVADNVARLLAEGSLAPATEGAVLFDWPLRAAAGLSDPGYFARTVFVDHNPATGALLDYDCGNRTYDTTDGSHRGTDFLIWPFPWLKMENEEVEIVAAAAGTIVLKQDGLYDKNCNCESGVSNKVAVRHTDGSLAWYLHMTNGSLTSKGVGAGVAAGEYLGLVGSSGCSTIPHLHFEVHDSGDNLIDPCSGACNSLNPSSWWIDQLPYRDSAVNRIVVGNAAPYKPIGCASLEQPNEASVFNIGDRVYLTTYFRETAEGQIATFRLLKPDGSEYESWTYEMSDWNNHARNYQRVINSDAGAWIFRVEFEGEIYERTFFMGETPAGEANSLLVGKSDAGVELTWSDSCSEASPAAGIHVGIIGNYYSHFGLGCNYENGSALLTWLEVQGPRYFVVVPVSPNREGSYGLDWNGAERPASNAYCFEQSIGCP